MNNTFEKKAGISLIVFAILMVLTMVMHPAGGSIEHLANIAGLIIITHSVAILSLPFGWIGFWGLTRKLGTDHFGSMLAFAMASVGLMAVLLAAAANGLVLPIFLQHYPDAAPDSISTIKLFLRYNFAVNKAFDYIYTGAFCLAILSWSVTILFTRKLAVWMGWLGVVVSIGVGVVFISGVAVNSLQGLRIFVSLIIVWILLAGAALCKEK